MNIAFNKAFEEILFQNSYLMVYCTFLAILDYNTTRYSCIKKYSKCIKRKIEVLLRLHENVVVLLKCTSRFLESTSSWYRVSYDKCVFTGILS